jgi:uncharacterized protein (TIGR03790 family)
MLALMLIEWRVCAAVSSSAVGLAPAQLAVVVNTADPLSVAIGDYYVRRRHIPPQNVARVSFSAADGILPAGLFAELKAAVDAQLSPRIQAYALTWMQPYRVGCMSVTTAFAFGYDPSFCAEGCKPTHVSPYFDSASAAPYSDFRLRPAMSLAATSLDEAKALIERGIAADGSAPTGTAYLLQTGDVHRDVRSAGYEDVRLLTAGRVRVRIVQASALAGRDDVMFYFIGAKSVAQLSSNRFLPGAVGDHLTSFGGVLTGSGQMSSLRWLQAGATGSYGTVVEPCNFIAKFPSPGLMLRHYLAGETLLEAYWKSVAMPGQGLFIGEPLAAPYRVALRAVR